MDFKVEYEKKCTESILNDIMIDDGNRVELRDKYRLKIGMTYADLEKAKKDSDYSGLFKS